MSETQPVKIEKARKMADILAKHPSAEVIFSEDDELYDYHGPIEISWDQERYRFILRAKS